MELERESGFTTRDIQRMTDDDLAAAWDERHAAAGLARRPARLQQALPAQQWEQFGFDPSERAHFGLRSREWTAVGQSELAVVREMTMCLREICEGRAPK